MKQQQRSRQKPAWVDNFLIRERVARWRARDRVKDWVRRLPRRVAYRLVICYAALSSIVFTGLIWWGVKHPHMRMVDEPVVAKPAMPILPETQFRAAKEVGEGLEHLMMEVRSDSVSWRMFLEALRSDPSLADTVKKLLHAYPALR